MSGVIILKTTVKTLMSKPFVAVAVTGHLRDCYRNLLYRLVCFVSFRQTETAEVRDANLLKRVALYNVQVPGASPYSLDVLPLMVIEIELAHPSRLCDLRLPILASGF